MVVIFLILFIRISRLCGTVIIAMHHARFPIWANVILFFYLDQAFPFE